MNEALREACRQGIELRCSPAREDGCSIGASRLGGRPDLPAHQEWPVARVHDLQGEVSLSLAFVGQIALTDVSTLTDELPSTGVLSFFLLDELRVHNCRGWLGGEAVDRAELTRVVYSPADVPLIRREAPVDVPPSRTLPVAALTFAAVTTWPQVESNVISRASHPRPATVVLEAEEYEAWAASAPENPPLQLLGHPCGCEFPIGDDPSNRLLLSLEAPSTGLGWDMFGRNGFVFVRIPEDALAAGRWTAARHKEW